LDDWATAAVVLDYDDLNARERGFVPHSAFLTAENELLEKYPACEKDEMQSPAGVAQRAAAH
jgi:hypothetical protein